MKVRTTNRHKKHPTRIAARGNKANDNDSRGGVYVDDKSTVAKGHLSNEFEVVLSTHGGDFSRRVRMNREGVTELRDELQRILDFNPQG